jgi:phosphopantothenoylcysteine synthetase/decarboxylase
MRSSYAFTGFLVGFAAETENLVANAMSKLERKGCDLVIANDVSRTDAGFDSEENEVILCFPTGHTELLPKQSKTMLAEQIISRVVVMAKEKLLRGS